MNHESLTRDRVDDTTESLEANTLLKQDMTPEARLNALNTIKDLRKSSWEGRRSDLEVELATQRLAFAAARELLRALEATVIVDGEHAGPGNFSAVGIKNDMSELIAVEGKAGGEGLDELGIAAADGSRIPQGSTVYFNEVFQRSPKLQELLNAQPDFAGALANGVIKVRYLLATATDDGRLESTELVLNPDHVDLGLGHLLNRNTGSHA
ncbi:hypothetical protein [Pseudoclavibacter helvolus]|uniref:hypothetical protein n=1 Tax=Pseudoclavibacter helvolus TaxID=255205 RepID=UPI0008393D3B|nr:hypothetical protein [Pseudoclavibacter helvolus]